MSAGDSELDKIIDSGKISPETAMVVFAVELKSQGEKLQDLRDAISADNNRYAPMNEHNDLKRRVSRVENAILGLLGFVFITVIGGLMTLVFQQGGK